MTSGQDEDPHLQAALDRFKKLTGQGKEEVISGTTNSGSPHSSVPEQVDLESEDFSPQEPYRSPFNNQPNAPAHPNAVPDELVKSAHQSPLETPLDRFKRTFDDKNPDQINAPIKEDAAERAKAESHEDKRLSDWLGKHLGSELYDREGVKQGDKQPDDRPDKPTAAMDLDKVARVPIPDATSSEKGHHRAADTEHGRRGMRGRAAGTTGGGNHKISLSGKVGRAILVGSAIMTILVMAVITAITSAVVGSITASNSNMSKQSQDCGSQAVDTISVNGDDQIKSVYSGLLSAGFSKEQAAGIAGNIQAESHGDPTLAEYGYANQFGISVPSNSLRGWGIAQWTFGRHAKLRDEVISRLGSQFYVSQYSSPPAHLSKEDTNKLLGMQISYLVSDLQTNYSSTYNKIKGETSETQVADTFVREFEVPANISATSQVRQKNATALLQKYGGDASAASSGGSADLTTSQSQAGSCNVGTGDPGSMADTKHLFEPSDSMSCPQGTIDVGVDNSAQHGFSNISIKLCQLPNDCTIDCAPNDGRHPEVNARVAGQFISMLNQMKSEGLTVKMTASFRTAAMQQALQHGGNPAAAVGMSLHQMGLAMDIQMEGGNSVSHCVMNNGRCTLPSSATWNWLNTNAAKYGITQLSSEYWHWEVKPTS